MNVKVVTFWNGVCPYEQYTLPIIEEYCERHGYELVFIRELHPSIPRENPERTAEYWWWKHTVLSEIIPTCDFVLWIDLDVVIVNLTRKVEDMIGGHNMLLSRWNIEYPDTGCMIFRNCQEIDQFLIDWGNNHHRFAEVSDINDPQSEFYPMNHSNHVGICSLFVDGYFNNKNISISDNTFNIIHVRIGERLPQTFSVHVPGTPVDEKISIFQQLIPAIIR